jgi:sigma-54 dependent transcriptional regulator
MPVLTLPDADAQSLTVRAKALVFEDPRSRAVLERIRQIARSEATVLVTGETGTGKEIVARHIHDLGPRAGKPFVAINCGAFPQTLVESELFGHERGAFTGATATRPGWFEVAEGGTLFLDEVGDVPLAVQVKLLRVLQEREVVRLGSRQPLPIDVRLIAATNVDLDEAVAAGRFREELYYRLQVALVVLPPLRERRGDVLPLARHFLAVHGQRLRGAAVELADDAEERLLAHSWPGNIRELENVVHDALLVCPGDRLAAEHLRLAGALVAGSHARQHDGGFGWLEDALAALFERNLPGLHARIEEVIFRSAYRFCHGNQMQAARLLGVTRNVLRARLIQAGALDGRPPPAQRALPEG